MPTYSSLSIRPLRSSTVVAKYIKTCGEQQDKVKNDRIEALNSFTFHPGGNFEVYRSKLTDLVNMAETAGFKLTDEELYLKIYFQLKKDTRYTDMYSRYDSNIRRGIHDKTLDILFEELEEHSKTLTKKTKDETNPGGKAIVKARKLIAEHAKTEATGKERGKLKLQLPQDWPKGYCMNHACGYCSWGDTCRFKHDALPSTYRIPENLKGSRRKPQTTSESSPAEKQRCGTCGGKNHNTKSCWKKKSSADRSKVRGSGTRNNRPTSQSSREEKYTTSNPKGYRSAVQDHQSQHFEHSDDDLSELFVNVKARMFKIEIDSDKPIDYTKPPFLLTCERSCNGPHPTCDECVKQLGYVCPEHIRKLCGLEIFAACPVCTRAQCREHFESCCARMCEHSAADPDPGCDQCVPQIRFVCPDHQEKCEDKVFAQCPACDRPQCRKHWKKCCYPDERDQIVPSKASRSRRNRKKKRKGVSPKCQVFKATNSSTSTKKESTQVIATVDAHVDNCANYTVATSIDHLDPDTVKEYSVSISEVTGDSRSRAIGTIYVRDLFTGKVLKLEKALVPQVPRDTMLISGTEL
jgi:hypothetical protein